MGAIVHGWGSGATCPFVRKPPFPGPDGRGVPYPGPAPFVEREKQQIAPQYPRWLSATIDGLLRVDPKERLSAEKAYVTLLPHLIET